MNKAITILKRPSYIAIVVAVTFVLIVLSLWLPNIQLILQFITGNTMNLKEKIVLLTSLLGSFRTNFTPLSGLLLVLTSILIGVQSALFTYFMGQRIKRTNLVGMSLIGSILSLIGIGCASCGSIIISSLIGLSSMVVVIGILPLKGLEFSIVGILLLLFAIKQTADKIDKPVVCSV